MEDLHNLAMPAAKTRGRPHPEEEHPYRSPFQRDRDRIIHSAHFRRLEYKTQVFVNGEGDNYRTRLTHTLEVNQIARTLARTLRLNEDLAEAVALSHDLGHTPFGHAGERVLHELMAGEGGFDHNLQGLRIVDLLETRYRAFAGLNLSHEVREAFFQHAGRKHSPETREFSAENGPLLEVQATLVADDIAYIAHDIDDGLYSGILNHRQLEENALWRRVTAVDGFDDLKPELKRAEGVRRLINLLVTDAIDWSRENIGRKGFTDISAIFREKTPIISFSPAIGEMKARLKEFLFHNFYRHESVMEVIRESQAMLEELWRFYVANPERMPPDYGKIIECSGVTRAATDYVAGMTDRYAKNAWRDCCRHSRRGKGDNGGRMNKHA